MLYKLLCSIEKPNAQVAQSVEQRTENPRVGGSIPSLSTIKKPSLAEGFLMVAKAIEASTRCRRL